ncbi:MAG: hypothetical protein NW207_06640 [Cytophagales bacterium]|nr:hypothetical protein [Cytophagales bacterium]
MITATIYIHGQYDPEDVIKLLIREQLIAFATHDLGITVYRNENGQMKTDNVNVIYVKTSALMYNHLIEHLDTFYPEQYYLFSTPIVDFSDSVKSVVSENVKRV